MSDPQPVYPGAEFWDELRAELARTGVTSLEAFDRDELPWVLERFARYWSRLEPVIDDFPQRRFAEFLSLSGFRFLVDGWEHVDGRVELVDIEIVTWEHPIVDPD